MEEVDMDGVGDAWGDDDGLDLGGDVETPAIGDEDMDGIEGEEGDEEEGGWEMEVRHCPSLAYTHPWLCCRVADELPFDSHMVLLWLDRICVTLHMLLVS
jgi:hypothetical protein